MTDKQRIVKLPKWAQDHITRLERRADGAENLLSEYVDDQTPSKVWHEDLLAGSKQYVQTRKVIIEHADVILEVNTYDDDRIQLTWRPSGEGYHHGDICFIPTSYQQARLVNPKNASL
jgi:hypothetical protein